MIDAVVTYTKKLRLNTKVTLCVALVQIPLLVSAAIVHIYDVRRDYLSTIEWRSQALAQPLLKRVTDLSGYSPEMQRTLGLNIDCQVLLKDNFGSGVIHVGVIGVDGIFIANADGTMVNQVNHVGEVEKLVLLTEPITVESSKAYHTFIPVTILSSMNTIAVLDIGFSSETVDNKIRVTVLYAVVTFVAFLLLSFLFIGSVLKYFITQPIAKLSKAAAAMAHGHQIADISITRSDEVGLLSDSFNHMRKSISDQISELQYKDFIIRSASSIITTANLEGNITYVNPSFLEAWRVKDSTEVLGRPFSDFWMIDESDQTDEIMDALLITDNKKWTGEVKAMRLDGSMFDVFVSAATVKDNEGNPIGLMVTSIDITRLKQAEKELKEFAQRLSIHVEQTPLGVIEWDLSSKVTQWNNSAGKIFGYSKKEAIGQTAFELIVPEEVHNLVQPIWDELVSGKGGSRSTNENLTKDGKTIICEWYNTTLLDSNGTAIGVASLVQDITDQKKFQEEKIILERQLQQSQKMEAIGTLAGGIAHDFNNILFPVLGHTEMLLQDIPENNPIHNKLKKIFAGANRAKELVKQILTFSRQEKSELMLIKIQPVIKEALKLIRATIPTTIEIKQDINPDCDAIKADPTQIHQIVMNLATNAYHAMEETGGILEISLKQVESGADALKIPNLEPGAYACLTIADTGAGIDEELTDKIFDPFFTTKAVGKGTGMGLSVVHGIIKNMNGTINVHSEPDRGTEFNVYFPIEKSSDEKQEIQTNGVIQTGIEHILLVDDEKAVVEMEQDMLERLGYKVTSRSSSIEALEAFRAAPDKFDIVITDMQMPNMSGDKLSVELTKMRPDIPILLCTGFSEIMSKEKAESLGIKGYLLKPIVMKDLSHKIREVLGEDI